MAVGGLRMYPEKWFSDRKVWGSLTALSVIAAMGSVVNLTWMSDRFNSTIYHYTFVADSHKIFAVTTAISSFMLFKNLKIPNNRIINTVAASTFGVLMIHANSDTMRQWLWIDFLNNAGAYGSRYAYIHPIVSIAGIFAVCTILDRFRIRYFEKPLLKRMFHS